jgi:hypothetical protein
MYCSEYTPTGWAKLGLDSEIDHPVGNPFSRAQNRLKKEKRVKRAQLGLESESGLLAAEKNCL